MRPEDFILDAERLVRRFGRWPDFHDAEVVSLRLDRRGPFGPVLEFVVRAGGWKGVVLPNGYYDDPLPTLVTFRCDGVDDNEFGGFNQQNVLNGLHFERSDAGVRVEFSAIHGVGGRVTCCQVSVADVVAANGQGEPAGEG